MAESPHSPRPVRRASIANLGCKVNQAEMEDVERLLRARGVELVDAHEAADMVVVNTCTVTSIADQKSRQAVRRARRTNPDALVLVTGCSVAIDRESLAVADPMALLFDNEAKEAMLAELAALLDIPEGAELPSLSGVEPAIGPAVEPTIVAGRSVGLEVDEGSVEDAFEREIDRTRVFVKIQDGCSFHCTYCIIPKARGPERSVPAETVLAEVRRAMAAGHREVVLTGINAGTYTGDGGGSVAGSAAGAEPAGSAAAAGSGLGLAGLVRRILAETEVERIRLSSIEPQHVTDDLLEVWAGSGGRCLPHFHVPLQSGDDTILRRMGRRYDAAYYGDLVERVRQAIPAVAVHADLIVGFPGEDDAAWARTAAFLRSLDLAGIHVFRYSARPGTAAARMVGQVDERTKKRRSAEGRARFAARQLGGELRVLFERQLPDGRWLGHAEDHVLVEVAASGGSSLENVIGIVLAESIDSAAPDRIVGRLLAIDPRQSAAVRPNTRRGPLAEFATK
jgi:threonylcarbamoyladenosine tRNA methylthiotransferase MtaB